MHRHTGGGGGGSVLTLPEWVLGGGGGGGEGTAIAQHTPAGLGQGLEPV